MQNQQIDPSSFDPKHLQDIICKGCKGKTFYPAASIKKASRIVTGLPEDVFMSTEVLICTNNKCGQILDMTS